MSTSITPEPADSTDPVVIETPAPVPAPASAHPDPITGEPGAHPVGVGVGALGAGAAGAAIGSIGGPIGMLIGAAIGAVAGGLAGKEVAATSEMPAAEETAAATEESSEAVGAGTPTPIFMNSMSGAGLGALGGSGFAGESALLPAGNAVVTGASTEDLEDDVLPAPTRASVASATGFQAPSVPESTPLAGAAMPHSGEEAVRVSAYYHFLDRETTGESGDALGDWLAAEREMMLS